MEINVADKLALACLFTKIKICSHESKREILGTSGNFHCYKVCCLVPKKNFIARKASSNPNGIVLTSEMFRKSLRYVLSLHDNNKVFDSGFRLEMKEKNFIITASQTFISSKVIFLQPFGRSNSFVQKVSSAVQLFDSSIQTFSSAV